MRDFPAAIAYVREAARLLRRRPWLLWVAVGLGAWNALDAGVLTHLAYHRTAWGRAEVRAREAPRRHQGLTSSETEARDASDWSVAYAQAQTQFRIAAPRIPALQAKGAATLAWAVTLGRVGTQGEVGPALYGLGHSALVPAADSLLPLMIGFFTCAGYLGIVREVVASGEMQWCRLWRNGRRFFWRLLLFGVLASNLLDFAAGLLFGASRAANAAMGWQCLRAVMVAVLYLEMTMFVVVWEDCSLWRAVKTSCRMAWRGPGVALVVVAGAGLAQWLAYQWYLPGLSRFAGSAGSGLLSGALTMMLANAAVHAVGAWFCVAAFAWCRGHERVPCRGDELSPGGLAIAWVAPRQPH